MHPFALRTYLCACVIFRMVLEPLRDPYLDLTAREFLAFYNLREASKGNVLGFRRKDDGQMLAWFQTCYSNAKAWTTRFFYISGQNWEYPGTEEVFLDFPIRTIWRHLPNEKDLWCTMLALLSRELARIATVNSWAKANLEALWTDNLVTTAHIDQFLKSPNQCFVQGRDFMITDTIPSPLQKPIEKTARFESSKRKKRSEEGEEEEAAKKKEKRSKKKNDEEKEVAVEKREKRTKKKNDAGSGQKKAHSGDSLPPFFALQEILAPSMGS
ncbi:uncharacterized protein LOC122289058 [Carya illinoinensis]|uniref:uncharacterized protein LOC122289058 n=1 Tax=Carya illinoinensis TaxID=32201 RepID=UPI001C7297E6|nr:uncharacterized protein LOC122289058 [Carya illinoinensis]